jgi:hypothetical protein
MDQLGFSTLLQWRTDSADHPAVWRETAPARRRPRLRARFRRFGYGASAEGRPNTGNTPGSRNASTAAI